MRSRRRNARRRYFQIRGLVGRLGYQVGYLYPLVLGLVVAGSERDARLVEQVDLVDPSSMLTERSPRWTNGMCAFIMIVLPTPVGAENSTIPRCTKIMSNLKQFKFKCLWTL